jgi:hypothetical protein
LVAVNLNKPMNKIQKIIITLYLLLSLVWSVFLLYSWNGENPHNILLALTGVILIPFISFGIIAFILYKVWADKK